MLRGRRVNFDLELELDMHVHVKQVWLNAAGTSSMVRSVCNIRMFAHIRTFAVCTPRQDGITCIYIGRSVRGHR